MKMCKRVGAIALLVLAMAGCGKSTSESEKAAASADPVISGVATPAAYDVAARDTLAHAVSVMNNEKPTEPELDGDIGKIEALLALSDKGDLDKERTHEAALTSTLGTLYARKAAINNTNPRTAGALIAKSYRYLDKAISLHPQDVMARINRGIVSAKVPDFLSKLDIAHEDLRFVRDSEEFDKLSPQLQEMVKQTLTSVDSRLAQAKREP